MALRLGQSPDHGFDQPLGLLQDCHRRIERFLGAMIDVVAAARGGPLTDRDRQALEGARRYFATAGRLHIADEEASVFPRLRAAGGDGAASLAHMLARLEADHRRAETLHAEVDLLLAAYLEAGGLGPDETAGVIGRLEALVGLYSGHIALEDGTLFPAAAELLSPEALDETGREMAARRGVPFRPPTNLPGDGKS